MQVYILESSLGQHVATVIAGSNGPLRPVTVVRGSRKSRALLDTLRNQPFEDGLVLVRYMSTRETVCLNLNLESLSKASYQMDIMSHLKLKETVAEGKAKSRVMIAPSSERLPDDGFLDFRVVEGIKDLLEVAPNTVLMFGKKQAQREALRVLVEFPSLFEQTPVVLSGIPGIDYDPEFESDAWNCQRVTYNQVIDDAVQTSKAAPPQADSIYAREKQQRSRADGTVKSFKKFDVTGAAAAEADVASDE